MRSRILKSMLLMGALNLGLMAHAELIPQIHLTSADVAVTYTASVAKPTQSSSSFWMQGGGINSGFTLYHGLGLAASFIGDHNANIIPGVGITKLSYMGGPRYTYEIKDNGEKLGTSIFGETLFGAAHAYNGVFPVTGGSVPGEVKTTANAFTMQVGGGLDLTLGKRIGLRFPEIYYVRTTLPNGGSNTQNDLRLAVGVSYVFRKR